jgi:hypothetical protein
MRTAFELGNSNCNWCLNSTLDDLRGQSDVEAVFLKASAGCLVVDHKADPEALQARVRSVVRGPEIADNGESVMVELDVHEEPRCRWPKPHLARIEQLSTKAQRMPSPALPPEMLHRAVSVGWHR